MIGDVSAAIDLVDFDSSTGEEFVASKNIFALRIPTEGEDRRVFKEQERVVDAVLVAEFDEMLLDGEFRA